MLEPIADGVAVDTSDVILSNSVVVNGPDGVLLVDPGLTRAELAALADALHGSGRRVAAGFATHPDWDHVLWHPALGGAPRYATARAHAAITAFLAGPDWVEQLQDGLPPEIADDVPLELFGELTALPEGATSVPWSGPEVRVLEHRGHAAGHAALLLPETGVLLAGDMLSDVLVPMPDLAAEDPLGDYLAALDLFEGVAASVAVVVPGHGRVGYAAALRARLDRDRAYVEALRDGREPADSRIGPDVDPGWEWVADVHAGQLARLRAVG